MTVPRLKDRIDTAEVIQLKRPVTATPYLWRDPQTIPPRKWVYGRQLLRGSVTVVVAPGATGKTALMIGTALSLATGRELLGQRVWAGPSNVWLWNLEDSGEEIARSIQAAAIHWSMTPESIGDRLFVDSGLDGAELKIAHETRDGFTINAPIVGALVDELRNRAIDCLIVDPFVSSHDVSENDNGAIDAIAKQWSRVAVEADCAIVLVHHSRKLGGGEVTAEASRGASSLVNAARTALVLNRMSEDEAKGFGIEGEERRRYFRVYDDKGNRAPPANDSDWFRLASVLLNNGDNGGDSIGVVVPWTAPDPFEGVKEQHIRHVQERLAAGDYRKSQQGTPWAGDVVADVLGLDITNGQHRARIKTLLGSWENNGALKVEDRKDASRRARPCLVPDQWVVVGSAPPPQGVADPV